MYCRSIAPLAVFLDLKFFALLLLVDRGRVVTSLALRTCESDYVCHVKFYSFHDDDENETYFSTVVYFFRM